MSGRLGRLAPRRADWPWIAAATLTLAFAGVAGGTVDAGASSADAVAPASTAETAIAPTDTSAALP